MVDIKNIPTEKLLVYCQMLERFGGTVTEIVAYADQAIMSRAVKKSDLEDYIDGLMKDADSNDKLLIQLQNELDKRLKRDLGISKGIHFWQTKADEFNDLMEKLKPKPGQIITEERPPLSKA